MQRDWVPGAVVAGGAWVAGAVVAGAWVGRGTVSPPPQAARTAMASIAADEAAPNEARIALGRPSPGLEVAIVEPREWAGPRSLLVA